MLIQTLSYLHDCCPCCSCTPLIAIREESSPTNVILQYKFQAAILSTDCSVFQQSYYVLHV